MKAYSLLVFMVLITGCATISPKQVSLTSEAGQVFKGDLVYSDPFSGTMTVENGPFGESFSGMFVVVDRTAVSSSGGALLAPAVNGGQPAFGSAQGSSSGNIDAGGFWHALGNKGAFMDCELLMGRQGHGKGSCKHSSGKIFNLLL